MPEVINYAVMDARNPLDNHIYVAGSIAEVLRHVEKRYGVVYFEGTPDKATIRCLRTTITIERVRE